MAVTLKQLAATMGLHHSTVAYALSGKGTVKEETRQRVRQTARELGYVANGLARRMRSKHSNVIGLVIPDTMRYFNELVQQLFRAALAKGYDIQVGLTEYNAELEAKAVRSLMESRVDGVIVRTRTADFAPLAEENALKQLAGQRVPTIAYGYPVAGSGFGTFQLPTQRATELLTQHLLELGHRRFALLLPSDRLAEPQRARIEGMHMAMRNAGLGEQAMRIWRWGADNMPCSLPADAAVLPADQPPAGLSQPSADVPHKNGAYLNQTIPRTIVDRGRELLRLVLAADDRPTAILCVNEATAIGVILEAQAQGLRVPADLAVAATSRTVVGGLSPLPLTTSGVDLSDVADAMIDGLVDWIAAPGNSAPTITLEPRLIVGTSTVLA